MKATTFTAFVLIAASILTGRADTVTYDEHNRITSIDYGAGKSIAYTYDKVGNRVTMVSTGLPAPSPYAANNVPVWWLNKYGFTTDLDAVTALDTDGDGQITANEWQAGTDPTDRNSVLKFDEFLVSNAGKNVDLRWKTEMGRRYRIEQSTNLENWDPVPGYENFEGTGNLEDCALTNLSGSKVFYRIAAWKP